MLLKKGALRLMYIFEVFRMTADLKKLTDSLRRDTPERSLQRQIERRRNELFATLRDGRSFEIRDVAGRVLRITPRRASR
jgi:hypothetical protein